ncbi:unnamed protein product [Schistosoma mattheei]|uniref:Uncharacterized protein n=1 Tax=Schistosoma mattheei TaxID=31246 RepID=A0A3P8KAH2_9TREM|nr:unnamed protein product [Schistosoma mattheei]
MPPLRPRDFISEIELPAAFCKVFKARLKLDSINSRWKTSD